MTTADDLAAYYAGLLILQYIGKPKAYDTISAITRAAVMPQDPLSYIRFSLTPTSGAFTLTYDGDTSASIPWDASQDAVRIAIQGLLGSDSFELTGTIPSRLLTLRLFSSSFPVPQLPVGVGSNTLLSTATAVAITIDGNEPTLSLAVQNGFNLLGINTAVGAQLDVIAKYVGASRRGVTYVGEPVVLSDSDLLTLIRFAIIKNTDGSSLYDIQSLINSFFGNNVLVFDYANMRLSYLVSTVNASFDLTRLIVQQGFLPKPMGVELAPTVFAPIINAFFGFRTYELAAHNVSPFNTYGSYQMTYPWLSYAFAYGPSFIEPDIPLPPGGPYFTYDGGAGTGYDQGVFLT